MDKDLTARIQQAVITGKEVRSAYYAIINLDDEQELGAPVSEADLFELEKRVGKPLPPSYRVFLTLYNGWSMAAGAIDILPVQEIIGGTGYAKTYKWQREAQAEGNVVASRSLVIGASDITPTKILLDPHHVNLQGEWACIQHHKGEEYINSSFLEWLEESIEEFREYLSEEERREIK